MDPSLIDLSNALFKVLNESQASAGPKHLADQLNENPKVVEQALIAMHRERPDIVLQREGFGDDQYWYEVNRAVPENVKKFALLGGFVPH